MVLLVTERLLREAWRRAGWSPGRQVPTHMVRAMWITADFPAWPAAMEVYAEFGGLTVALPGFSLDFDAAFWLPNARGDASPDWCPVAKASIGEWLCVDADGRVQFRGQEYPDLRAFWRWAAAAKSSRG